MNYIKKDVNVDLLLWGRTLTVGRLSAEKT
jgi:hypothetical protein